METIRMAALVAIYGAEEHPFDNVLGPDDYFAFMKDLNGVTVFTHTIKRIDFEKKLVICGNTTYDYNGRMN